MMASRSSAIVSLGLLLVFLLSVVSEIIHLPDEADVAIENGDFTGRARMKMNRDELNSMVSHVNSIADAMECGEPTRVFRHAGIHEEEHVNAELDLWYETSCGVADASDPSMTDYEASSLSVVNALQRLRTHLDQPQSQSTAAKLHSIYPVLRVRMLYETDDPQLDDQSEHYNSINLPEAWDLGAGDSSIVVQVLDSGLDLTHPDHQNNLWVNSGEICDNGVDDDNNGFIDDCNGYNHADNTGTELLGDGSHGTHCSGTVAADNDNSLYVAGVAGGKNGDQGASLMTSVGFGSDNTGGFAEALVYGADNGAHVSSNSWGYTSANVYNQDTLDAIDYAVEKGVIVVFAAGNDNDDGNWYPGYYGNAVAVAALNNDGSRASFSNYGSWIQVSAPGVSILSTVTVSDGYTAYYSGTSMACPHVAGLLALGLSLSPSTSYDDTLNCLYNTASDIDDENSDYVGELGAGRIDAYAFAVCMSTEYSIQIFLQDLGAHFSWISL